MKKKLVALAATSAVLSTLVAFVPFAETAEVPVITFDNVDVNPGTQAVVPLYLENNYGIDGYAFDITYDTDAMKLVEIAEADCGEVICIESPTDEGSFMFGNNFDTMYQEEEAVLCELVFDVYDNAALGEYMLNINGCGVFNNDENINCDIWPGSINVTDEDLAGIINGLYTPSPTIIASKILANPGAETHLPITIKNNSGFDALELTITYNSDYFTYINTIDGIVPASVTNSDGEITYKITGNVSDSDVLSYIAFKVNYATPTGSYPISIDVKKLTLEGNVVEYNKVNGEISVTEGEIEDSEGDGVYDNQLYFKLYKDYAAITGYETAYDDENNMITDVVIPDTIEGLPVKEISDWAFSYQDEITSIALPDTITTIGDGAFLYCSELTSVNIPEAVTTIGDDAFNMCSGITSFTIPKNVKSIGVNAFLDCQALSVAKENASYIMENGVLMNADKTRLLQFTDKTASSYTVPSTVQEIDMYAFYDISALTKVVLPETVTSINEGTFYGCTSLADVNIPTKLTSIGNEAFTATKIKEISIPATVTDIGVDPFSCCEAMTDINVDDANKAYTSVDGVLFNKDLTTLIKAPVAANLGDYVVPDTVKEISENAFDGNSKLNSVKIPAGVNNIGACAFDNCANLNSVNIMGMNTMVCGIEFTIANVTSDEGDAVYSGVISGYEGCEAQDYAKNYGYTFEPVSKSDIAGDVNADGVVDVVDVDLMIKYLLTQRGSLNFANSDLVNDGVINVFDLIKLKRMVANM